MLINLRNALMSGKRLPYDAEVEYLESTGTQWINTGITPTISDTTRIVSDLSLTSINTSDNNIVFGNYAISPAVRQFAFVDTSAKARIAYVGAASGSVTIAANSDYLFEAQFAPGGSYLKVNGATSSQNTSTATVPPSWPLSLFACRYEDSVISPSSMRLRSCKIYLNGVLVRDYIPVRRGTVGYLYDRVSGRLFGNAGTGDFVLGQDVVPVEYIESSGTQHINTGIVPYPDMPLDISAYVSSSFPLIDARNYIFGSMRQGPGSTAWRCHLGLSPTNSNAFAGIGEVYADQSYPQLRNAWVRITQSQGKTLSANGIVLASSANSYGANLTAPIWLFGCCVYANYNSTVITERHGACRIGSAIVGNCSFRSVRVGTEGAMMDVLTRRIYRNAGTGAFSYGNDLKYPIPAE